MHSSEIESGFCFGEKEKTNFPDIDSFDLNFLLVKSQTGLQSSVSALCSNSFLLFQILVQFHFFVLVIFQCLMHSILCN